MALDGDGKRLAAAARGDAGVNISIWNTADGALTHSWPIENWHPSALAFSPDGRYLACALHRFGPDGNAWEPSVQLLHLAGDAGNAIGLAAQFGVGENFVVSLAFAPDGRTLAILAPTTLRLWDVPSCRELTALKTETGGADAVVFSRDGKLLAVAMDTQVKILDLASRKWRLTLKHPYGVGSVAFSPDGGTLAAIVNDRPARLWNVATGELKGTVPTGANQSGFIAFTKAGNKLVTFSTKLVGGTWSGGVGYFQGKPRRTVSNRGGTTKGLLELWDLQSGAAKTELIAPTAKVQTVVLCPATGLLATAGAEDDSWIELWDLESLAN